MADFPSLSGVHISHYRLAFLGFGNVGRALARLLERKRAVLESQYDITFSVAGIATGKNGFAINPDGLDAIQCIQAIEAGESLDQFTELPVSSNFEFIERCQAEVLFENTP